MGLFSFSTGFTGGPSSSLEREYLDYMRQRDAAQAAEARAAEERARAAYTAYGDRQSAYQADQDDRAYHIQKQSLALKRKELLEVGIPQAKVDKWYREAQMALARDQLLEDRRQFDARLQEDQRQFNVGTDVDILKTRASLTGPENVFAAADFSRGVQERGGVPYFLQALNNRGDVSLAGGADSYAPTPTTIGSLVNRLTPGAVADGGAGGGYSQEDEAQRALNAITPIAMNPGKLAPGSWDRLMPSEQKILGAGISKVGVDQEDWVHRYRQNSGLGFSWSAA